MGNAIHNITRERSRRRRVRFVETNRHAVVAMILAAFALGGAMHTVRAQENPPPSAEQKDDDLRLQAPIGAREPRPRDLPENVLRNEGRVAPEEREFDRRLEICRGC
jgi:hypothetical protein